VLRGSLRSHLSMRRVVVPLGRKTL